MKLVIVSGIFPPDIGGPASYVPKIAAALTQRGHSVRVICLSNQLTHEDAVYPFPVQRIRRSLFKPFRVLKTIVTIARQAKKADVIYANTLGFESFIGGVLASRPVVHKVVGDYAWEKARNNGWFAQTIDVYQQAPKSFKLRFLDWHRAIPLKYADAVIVPSHYLKKMVTGWGVAASKITVVYNAVAMPTEPEIPVPEKNAHQTVLATVCRLTPWKGVEAIIRYTAQNPHTYFNVVGDGPLRGELEQLAQQLQVENRVKFWGNLDKQQVYEVLKQSDVFVLNSTYEGLPHVILEAMACKIPVVCNNIGGCSEVVQHGVTGILLEQDSKGQTLGMALDQLVQDKAMRLKLAENAFHMLNHDFSIQKMYAETENLLSGNVQG